MAQTKQQLKALRKKYHLGEFRNHKSHSTKRGAKTKMPRHRRSRRSPFRKSYRRSRRSGGMGGIAAQAIGVGGYIAYEALLKPKLVSTVNISPMIVNIGEIAIGTYLARKGGVVGSIGRTAVVLNVYQLLRPLVAGSLGGSSSGYFS